MSLLLFKSEIIDNKLSSLRLGQGGWQDFHENQLPPLDYSKLDLTSPRQQFYSYILGFEEELDFPTFWQSVSSQPWSPNLSAAGRRLLFAQNRMGGSHDEDTLVDLIIAFEALVVKKKRAG